MSKSIYSTYIPRADLSTIIRLSGQEIRNFLEQASPDDFRGEANGALKSYRKDKSLYSDKLLIEYGSNVEQAINYPMRIEVRHSSGFGAAQVVAKGVWGAAARQAAMKRIREELAKLDKQIEVRLAGTSSFEFNIKEVNKSLPIRYLRHAWGHVLAQMNYTPGAYIDSRKTFTIIAADGDGTIYDGPKAGHDLPTMAKSIAKDALIGWLEAGGVFMLNSGNQLSRNVYRIKDGIPAHLFNRILVCGNGGADLVCFDDKQNAVEVKGYSELALSKLGPKYDLDIIYIGDDGSEDGNDWAGFVEVGFDRAVLVAKDFKRNYDARLRTGYAGHFGRGTKTYLEIATLKAKNAKGKPFLSAWAVSWVKPSTIIN